jgi:hypothetical protein
MYLQTSRLAAQSCLQLGSSGGGLPSGRSAICSLGALEVSGLRNSGRLHTPVASELQPNLSLFQVMLSAVAGAALRLLTRPRIYIHVDGTMKKRPAGAGRIVQ